MAAAAANSFIYPIHVSQGTPSPHLYFPGVPTMCGVPFAPAAFWVAKPGIVSPQATVPSVQLGTLPLLHTTLPLIKTMAPPMAKPELPARAQRASPEAEAPVTPPVVAASPAPSKAKQQRTASPERAPQVAAKAKTDALARTSSPPPAKAAAATSPAGAPDLEAMTGPLRLAPRWLRTLLRTPFFDACAPHADLRKAECNFFCLDCCTAMCPHCLPSHTDHRVLQIRRYVYHEVARQADMAKLMDVSGVQPYVINSARVLFLNERPQPRPGRGGGSECATCGRCLQAGFEYCSVACKASTLLEGGDTLELPASAVLPPPLEPPPRRARAPPRRPRARSTSNDSLGASTSGSASPAAPASPTASPRAALRTRSALAPALIASGVTANTAGTVLGKRQASLDPEPPCTPESERVYGSGNVSASGLPNLARGGASEREVLALTVTTTVSRRKKKMRPARAATF